MRRVLLLMTTTSYRAGAFLDAAGRLGVEVVAGTDRPQALAAFNPAGHLVVDFLDPERSAAAVADFSRRVPLAAVVAAEDEGVRTAAAAAAALGLPHASLAAVEACQDKLRMRRRLQAEGVPSPGFRPADAGADPAPLAAQVRYPCVLKPTRLSGSRGVVRADDPESFVAAFDRVAAILREPDAAARCGPRPEILIEDYLPGREVALEGLLTDGRLRTLALFDKPDPMEGPSFEETIYVTPSRHDEDDRDAAAAMAGRVAAALGLDQGPVHAELRFGPAGPRLVEIAPRSIGGLCSRSLRFGTDVSLEELILRHALGLGAEQLDREAAASGVMMIPVPVAGVLRGVRGLDDARAVPGIDEVRITIPPGQPVVPPPEGTRYLGFIFARGELPESVEAALRAAHRRIGFDIDAAGIVPVEGARGDRVAR